ncbi:MAG: CHAT domain-containing protein [Acidobacteriota bacterium]
MVFALLFAMLVTVEPGIPIQGTLEPGSVAQHVLDLDAGEWMVRITQQGVDVEVEIVDPADASHGTIDSPIDEQGAERYALRVEQPGVWRLEARAHAGWGAGGRYEIEIEPLDARHHTAAFEDTDAARAYAAGDRRTALEHYQKASQAWSASGVTERTVATRYAAAVLLRLLDDNPEAIAAHESLRADLLSIGRDDWAANTWNNAGLARWKMGEIDAARVDFTTARERYEELGDARRAATARNNLCLIHHSRSELDDALTCYDEVITEARHIDAVDLEARVSVNSAAALDMLARRDQALERYQQALSLLERYQHPWLTTHVLNNLGTLHYRFREYQDAIRHQVDALERVRESDNRRLEARILNALGDIYLDLGDVERATAYHRDALPLRQATGDRRGEAATRVSLAIGARQRRDFDTAESELREALALDEARGDTYRVGIVHYQLARTHLERDDADAARLALDIALESVRESGNARYEVLVNAQLGDTLDRLGRHVDADTVFDRAIALATKLDHDAGLVDTLYLRARATTRRDALDRATDDLEACLEVLESQRLDLGSPDLRSAFTATVDKVYELYVDVLLTRHERSPTAGFDRQAFAVSERSRARTLVELLQTAGALDLDPGLAFRRRDALRALHTAAEQRLTTMTDDTASDDDRQAATRALNDARSTLEALDGEIDRTDPARAARAHPTLLDASGVQALLDPETTLVAFVLGSTRSALFTLTHDSFRTDFLPPADRLAAAARTAWEQLASPGSNGRIAASAFLPEPPATERIAIVADGPLHYLPFGALVDDDGYPWIERHELVTLPSASALALLREGRARTPSHWVSVFADPVFQSDDPRLRATDEATTVASERSIDRMTELERLPATRVEAEAIASLAPDGDVVLQLDFDAHRDALLDGHARHAQILHLATHGLFDARAPELSAIVLSRFTPDGEAREGALRIQDIYGLDLAADLVVLSGCQTALGDEVRGEGLIGLTRGFLYAGTPRVVASLWRVPERATAALMEHFYRRVREGASAATALRDAQRQIRAQRRWRHPYFWGAFVLQGDWR